MRLTLYDEAVAALARVGGSQARAPHVAMLLVLGASLIRL